MLYRIPVFIIVCLFTCSVTPQELPKILEFTQPAIAYSPKFYSPAPNAIPTSREQITRDLKLLHKTGFRSLVTYTASGEIGKAPEIARNVGFNGFIVMGIWDPLSPQEWTNALSQASFVDGYCMGNEGLDLRYSKKMLAKRMAELRKITGHPVTTSEPIDAYFSGQNSNWLLSHSDWLFPTAHPYWASRIDPEEAVEWIVARHDYLVATTGKAALIKEAGLPNISTAINGNDKQIAFFSALESTGIPFFYFEAFDQPWKADFEGKPGIEAHWGLFDSNGSPKKVADWLTERWIDL